MAAVKTVGLLGGMSWESSALYYRLLNEAVRDRLGGLHSLGPDDVDVPVFPTTALHVEAALAAALA
jgi:aspartate/glutamate racemase